MKHLLLLVCFTMTLWATAADAPAKVGVVQVSKIIKAHWNYDTIKKRVQDKQDEVEAEFKKMQDEGRMLLEKLKQADEALKNPLLNEAAKTAKANEKRELQQMIQQKSMDLEKARVSLSKSLRRVEQSEMNAMLKGILDEVQAYGKKHGYTLIQDASATPGRMSTVVYHQDSIDITDEIIKVINAGHETPVVENDPDTSEKPE